MENLILPKQYKSELNLHDTQLAIKTVKDFFQDLLAKQLNLLRAETASDTCFCSSFCRPGNRS